VIQKGDLVRVVWACCRHADVMNMVFTVGNVERWNEASVCLACHFVIETDESYAEYEKCPATGRPHFIPVSWLKKIEPPAVKVTKEEKVTA
jgi:hypothetical protein